MPLIGQKIETTLDNFGALVADNCLLVDKSLMIKEFWDGQALSLIVRPHRFGKSLNLSMLQHFFAASINGISTKGMFNQFKIATIDEGKFLKEHQGQYPVILVTFKDVKEHSYEAVIERFRNLCRELYDQHKKFVLNSDQLDDDDKKEFRAYLEGKTDDIQLAGALKFLSKILYKAYGNKKVIILIDEYDAPLTAAYEHGFLDQLSNFMRNMFGMALKGNQYVQKGLMMGILRVSQSSMLSGLNNLVTYTVLNKNYQAFFGFTEQEVTELVERVGIDVDIEKVRALYNGYQVGETIIYNPWSIMQFVCQNSLKPHWVLSANDKLLKQVLLNSSDDAKQKLGELIQGKTVDCAIKPNLRYEDLMENPDTLWTLLLLGGYLTAVDEKDSMRSIYSVKIPNVEVLEQYRGIFSAWLEDKMGEIKYHRFLSDLTQGNVEAFTQSLGEFMLEVLSVKDVGGDKTQPERFYHGLVIGLIASLKDTYHISSNRESGLGFYDTMLVPKASDTNNNGMAIILEFKRCFGNEDMEAVAKNALTQIDTMSYQANLTSYPHVEKVLCMGLAFCDKSVQSAYKMIDLTASDTPASSPVQLSEEYGDVETIVTISKKRKRVEESDDSSEELPTPLSKRLKTEDTLDK